ncbi:bifunctional coenzyme A synthase isoform X2 [Schistocerca americana]|uniref:bifunctional coenzyme A synthase isoform X2 n=1 Tax=Schistocerca americana TaxID=7009 RepID=UPI001F4F6881|nr:bifunctional coenzyme A synthase isoform X2 [Schistocerca americana]
MGKTGLFVVSNPSRIRRFLPVIQKHVQNTLYVQFTPSRSNLVPSSSQKNETFLTPPHHSQTVIKLYSQTAVSNHNLDVRVLLSTFRDPLLSSISTRKKIEVVFFDRTYNNDEVHRFVKSCLSNVTQSCEIVTLNDASTNDKEDEEVESPRDNFYVKTSQHNIMNNKTLKVYDNVVLGGTFDRLHLGHRIILSEAVLHCTKRITVGVTDTPMLQSKKLWELIAPCCKRMSSVEDFLNDVEPNLEYNVVPITDPYGPTRTDPTLQMIVVSAETYKGGLKVNDLRRENGLSQLDIHTVELLEPLCGVSHPEEELKISSSNERMRLLGTQLKLPEEKLQSLNELLWPAMLTVIKERAQEMYRAGKEVIIVEAAVLLQANWDKHCHEVWTCLISPEESVKRLQSRNNLSESDAKARLSNQTANTELVEKSNVVFCTLWSPEFTQVQVNKAWTQLQQFLHGDAKQ